jgi:hypothetical protein
MILALLLILALLSGVLMKPALLLEEQALPAKILFLID